MKRPWLAMLVLVALGCGSLTQLFAGEVPPSSLQVSSVRQLAQCAAAEAGLQLLERKEQLDSLSLAGGPLVLDFSANSLLVVYLGFKPNSGYQVSLLSESALLLPQSLQIEVMLHTPQPGMMYAQVITSPCLLVEIPKGDYAKIEVVDQHGASLGVATR